MKIAKEKINLLDVIPTQSKKITIEKVSDGTIVITYQRFRYRWMQRLFLPKGMSAAVYVRLEEHGSAVWECIDDKRTVGEIIEKLAEHFCNEANYESRVITYIYQLQKDGFITFLRPYLL